ncbi:RCC1-like G exchanging factor-like protein [Tubulanus polymorphus]|uniref:RCC1-like G exchanging factor-like protein n=1 Tax=Tubulanus polymorphus TaxID=672921 RepID=UPI003DA62D6F
MLNQVIKTCVNSQLLTSKGSLLTAPLGGAANLLQQKRFTRSWKKRAKKKLDANKIRESVIVEYAGDSSKQANQVFCWGHAITGALGIQSFVKPPRKSKLKPMPCWHHPYRMIFWEAYKIQVQTVGCGYGFTVFSCKTPRGQAVYGCGINTDSQLGYQEFPRKSGRILDYVIEPCPILLPFNDADKTKVTKISCGRAHTVLLTDNEGVFAFGNNSYGQCGRSIHEHEKYRGSAVIQQLEIVDNVIDVVCGQDHTLVLTETGHVYSCGFGGDGQTGVGNYNNTSRPTRIRGDIDGERIVQITSKADTVYAVSDKGDLFGWGNSEYHQLLSAGGDSMQIHTPKHIPLSSEIGKVKMAASGGTICAVLNDIGRVFVWGYGILGKGPAFEQSLKPSALPEPLFGKSEMYRDRTVTGIYCGLTHFAAINNNNDLYVWGRNKHGSLGLGNMDDQFFPFKVSIPGLVQSVHCGVDHMFALCKTLV